MCLTEKIHLNPIMNQIHVQQACCKQLVVYFLQIYGVLYYKDKCISYIESQSLYFVELVTLHMEGLQKNYLVVLSTMRSLIIHITFNANSNMHKHKLREKWCILNRPLYSDITLCLHVCFSMKIRFHDVIVIVKNYTFEIYEEQKCPF